MAWAPPLPMPDGEGRAPTVGHGEIIPVIPLGRPARWERKKYYFISRCSPPLVPDSNAESCLWSRGRCTELAISSSSTALDIVTVSANEPGLAISSVDSHALSASDICQKKVSLCLNHKTQSQQCLADDWSPSIHVVKANYCACTDTPTTYRHDILPLTTVNSQI